MRTIVWTRPIEDWICDQKFLKPEELVLHFPLTRQVFSMPTVPSKAAELIIVTSRKAAEAFLNLVSAQREAVQKIEIVTFGMETYKYLLGQKMRARLIDAPTAKDFGEILLSELKRGTTVWFPRPLETAFPLSDRLRAQGIEVFEIEVYRTEPLRNFDVAQVMKLSLEPCVVCFASPSAVKSFVDLIRTQDEARFYKYTPVAIGHSTMNSAQSYFNEIYVAQHSSLTSLWDRGLEVSRMLRDKN